MHVVCESNLGIQSSIVRIVRRTLNDTGIHNTRDASSEPTFFALDATEYGCWMLLVRDFVNPQSLSKLICVHLQTRTGRGDPKAPDVLYPCCRALYCSALLGVVVILESVVSTGECGQPSAAGLWDLILVTVSSSVPWVS